MNRERESFFLIKLDFFSTCSLYRMVYAVLLALLAFCATASAVDTEGTHFVFSFVRNANPDITNQVLSATIINRNAADCKFTLQYRPDFGKYTNPENMTITVLSMNVGEIEIPSWYGFNYTGRNVQDDVYLTLVAFSTSPVTLLANNYDNVTKQGDTYMVLPTTWGSQSFTFSLPPSVISNNNQYEQVFVLPTTEGTTKVTFAEIGQSETVFYFNATYGNTPAVYVGDVSSDLRPKTYHVLADKPVLIVAGVTCAGTDPSACDHIAYMPHPPAASDCFSYEYYDDDHISFLPTTSQFFTDIPGTCLIGQNITRTLNDGTTRTITIKPQMESPLWTVDTTNARQLGVAFHNGGSNIHIARYYDGTKYSSRGAFIATSPSITQFHADSSAFHTRNANDSVEIYCTVLTCASLTLDGEKVYNENDLQVVQTVDDVAYYVFVTVLAKPGFHKLYLDPGTKGNYAFFVFGKNGQYSYGYEGGVNKPTVVLAPTTTSTPFTGPTTSATSTTTVTTKTLPTTTTSKAASTPTTTVTTAPTSSPTASTITLGTTAPVTTASTAQPSTVTTIVTAPTTATVKTTQTTATAKTQTSVVSSSPTPSPVTVTKVVTTPTLPIILSTASTQPLASTSTTAVTSPTTRLVTETKATPPLQTSSPAKQSTVASTVTVKSTPTPSTVASTQSTATPQKPVTSTSTVTTPAATTKTTPAATTKSTPAATTKTTPVATQSIPTSTVPQTNTSTTPTVPITSATDTPPSTTTDSSSTISLVIPALFTIFFAIV
uniref:Uncharacterized protein n=2 Tax=Caenorhabditis japonica TaxID=281687 RepID=A0A8R1IAX0_CAEJA